MTNPLVKAPEASDGPAFVDTWNFLYGPEGRYYGPPPTARPAAKRKKPVKAVG